MVVISRKRIVMVTSILCIAIFVCNIVLNRSMNNEESVATVALPVSNKVIVIDAGHGKPDEGAQSSNRYY